MNKKDTLANKNWGTFVVLFIGSIAMIFPFVWMFLSSFKTKADVYVYPPQWLPSQWNWDNFEAVFEMIPFLRYYGNSIYTSVMQTLIIIVVSVLAAYALTKLRFPGQEVFNMFMLSSMFVPMVVTMIPMYLMVSSMGMADTFAGIILPQINTAFTTMLIAKFFMSIPTDLIDAAKLDGCGYFRILTKVMIPNTKGAIATATLFTFLGAWKSYTWPLIITTDDMFRTLPIGLKYLVTESSSEYQLMMAASLMTILPILILFIFCEKQMVKSITLTGMKS